MEGEVTPLPLNWPHWIPQQSLPQDHWFLVEKFALLHFWSVLSLPVTPQISEPATKLLCLTLHQKSHPKSLTGLNWCGLNDIQHTGKTKASRGLDFVTYLSNTHFEDQMSRLKQMMILFCKLLNTNKIPYNMMSPASKTWCKGNTKQLCLYMKL